MLYYQLTFQGPQTSKTVHGRHFRNGVPTYLTEEELPVSLAFFRRENIVAESIEADDRPAIKSSAQDHEGSGIEWIGTVNRKTTEHGVFFKGQPRYDLSPAAMVEMERKPGFRRVGA